MLSVHLILNFCLLVTIAAAVDQFEYNLGVGIADVTGPAAEIAMFGYAKMEQVTGGIHTRLWSRAFIINRGDTSIVFVSVDAATISQLLKSKVVESLEHQFGNIFTDSNVCISSTHTHSGPGGFTKEFLYDITSYGFVKQTFRAMLDGIVLSIVRASQNIKPGYIYYNRGDLFETSVNRSPAAYLQNPSAERAEYETDVDTEMILLKLTDLEGNGLGMINWFAVHGTSMNSSNHLISSDNKGYASLLFEEMMNGNLSVVGKGQFVAAFAQSNEGDVSPNTRGPICVNTGKECDFETSTCGGWAQPCIARGPADDMFESTRIIGLNQFTKAWELWKSAKMRISGPVKFVHQYVVMSRAKTFRSGKMLRGCLPALGHSFAAGTTDGPGEFNFKQHTIVGNESRFWKVASNFFFRRPPELEQCHYPKPILISQFRVPTQWLPEVVPLQVIQIGNLLIAAVPGEMTTMAGRRLRKGLYGEFFTEIVHPVVVIAGLSNSYTNYITTREEYEYQRYEGASTLYGPHTLDIYIDFFENLARYMFKDENVPTEIPPSSNPSSLINFSPLSSIDLAMDGPNVGKIIDDAQKVYRPGSTVQISFASSNPRHGIKLQSFFYVEHLDETTNKWSVIATDANWETRFYWKTTNLWFRRSKITIYWTIPKNAKRGVHRIRFQGMKKGLQSKLSAYEGVSTSFIVDDLMYKIN